MSTEEHHAPEPERRPAVLPRDHRPLPDRAGPAGHAAATPRRPGRLRPRLLAPWRRAGLDLAAGERGARRRQHQRRRPRGRRPRRLRVRAPRGAGTLGRDQRGRGDAQYLRRGTRRARRPAVRREHRHLVRPAVWVRAVAADRPGPPRGLRPRPTRGGASGGVGGAGRSPPRHLPRGGRCDPGARPGRRAGCVESADADGRPDPALRRRDLRRDEGSLRCGGGNGR